MRHFLLSLCFIAISFHFGYSQNSKLANQYYYSGEYEKAAEEYKRLYEKSKHNDYYFNRYIESLLAQDLFEESEKVLKRQIKARPNDVQLYVMYGNIFEKMEQTDKAEKQYLKAIKQLTPDRNIINNLGSAYLRLLKYDYALQAYEKGEALLDNEGVFSWNIADIYRRQGDTENMIKYYLISLKENPSRLSSMKEIFNRVLSQEHFEEMKVQLYTRVQEEPDNVYFPELLEWVFIQEKDYKKALRQAKSIDFKLEENGSRIFNIASIASNDKDYDTAIDAYQYIIDEKGKNSSFYFDAKQNMLNVKKQKVLYSSEATTADFKDLEAEYERFLTETGRNKQSAYIIIELAKLEAFYLNDMPKAISLLKEMISYPGVNKYIQANGKLNLGDFYLITGERWESTLLYSQVDKDFREDYLGELARFKNARLSYYTGDFEWAQSQFDILKSSTSKLISNDAIDLSVFIMDNMNLDTTDVPLQMYAESELLTFQNQFEKAFSKLEELEKSYPEHSLKDDIYYAKAKLYVRQRKYDEAINMYQQIIDNHLEEIRCDNAIFELAEIYHYTIEDTDKAAELYEKLFIDFSNSTFAVDARKRYRILRGDNIQ